MMNFSQGTSATWYMTHFAFHQTRNSPGDEIANVNFLTTTLTVDILHQPSVYHVYHIIVSDVSLKTGCFGIHFCRRKFR